MRLPVPGDELLGKYVLERQLGEGGMGIVYGARHVLLDQRVAVKFLRPEGLANAEAVARFVQEARAAARIDSDHVARVFDVGILDQGLPYMVLEFLEGCDLGHLLSDRGPLPVSEATDYVLQAIDAVAHAHALGIVHRDLKPTNLFLARRHDGTSRVKVLDFGISKAMRGVSGPTVGLTRSNALLGTPAYMSPEQLLNAKGVDHRCDVWAFGVITYELLTGRLPFTADNPVALFAAILDSEPASMRSARPDLMEAWALESAVMTCLRRDPSDRFPSVAALARALAPFATPTGLRAAENAERVLPSNPVVAVPSAVGGTQGPTSAATDSEDVVTAVYVPTPGARVHLPSTSQVASRGPTLLAGHAAADVPAVPRPDLRFAIDTAEPWSSHRPLAPLAHAGRLRFGVVGLGVVVAAALVGSLVLSIRWGRPVAQTSPAVDVRSAESLPSVPTAASSDAAPPQTTNPPAAPNGSLVDGQPPPPEHARSGPALDRPQTAHAVDTTRGGASPRETAPATPARPQAATSAASSTCNPPFVIDGSGKKRWKLDCL